MRNAKGVVDRTSLRSSPAVSMRSPSRRALTVTNRLIWLDNSLTGVEATTDLRTQGAPERFLSTLLRLSGYQMIHRAMHVNPQMQEPKGKRPRMRCAAPGFPKLGLVGTT